MSPAVIDAIRVAASSMAKGIPSGRRQISSDCGRLRSASFQREAGRQRLRARSTNSAHRRRVDALLPTSR